MRFLFVTDEFPWPARGGYQMRMAQMLDALGELGEIDLVVAAGSRHPRSGVPDDSAVARAIVVRFHGVQGGRLGVAAKWLLSGRPRVLLRSDYDAAAREVGPWLRPQYDLAWFSHSESWHGLGHLPVGPTVVDLDNLNGFSLAHRRLAYSDVPRSRNHPDATTWSRALTDLTDRYDEGRWRRMDMEISRRVSAVVVCSDLDRRRLEAPNAHVVPNGYRLPEDQIPPSLAATPDLSEREGSSVVMIGQLGYEPNLEGAFHFTEHIFPAVRQQIPNAQLRLVGRYRREADVSWLRRQPSVTVVGEVDDVTPELAAAAVVVVPLRFGGGTRIKTLEAFAHRRPVVTTEVGREGIDAVHGKHLLVAADAGDFARACVRVMEDRPLAVSLAEAGHQLWRRNYSWDSIRPRVHRLVGDLTDVSGHESGSVPTP